MKICTFSCYSCILADQILKLFLIIMLRDAPQWYWLRPTGFSVSVTQTNQSNRAGSATSCNMAKWPKFQGLRSGLSWNFYWYLRPCVRDPYGPHSRLYAACFDLVQDGGQTTAPPCHPYWILPIFLSILSTKLFLNCLEVNVCVAEVM